MANATLMNPPKSVHRGAAKSRKSKPNDGEGVFSRFMASESGGARLAKTAIAVLGSIGYMFGVNWGLSMTSASDAVQDGLLAGAGVVAGIGFGIGNMPRAATAFSAVPVGTAALRAGTRWSADRAAQQLLDAATAQARAGQTPATTTTTTTTQTPTQGAAQHMVMDPSLAALPAPAAGFPGWNPGGFAEMPSYRATIAQQPAYPMPGGLG